jgi:NodT family efflux transporter outer membrane factor (OMF) lipoprotein
MKTMCTARSTAIAGVALAMLSVLGCNLAPKYSRPTAPAPDKYKEEAPPGVAWTVAQPRETAAAGRWWEIYGDRRLDAFEEQVEIANQGIIAAEANYRMAKAAVTAARSGLFPTITAAPTFNRVRPSQTWDAASNSTAGGLPAGATNPANSPVQTILNEYSLPVDATYEVDLWHRIGNSVTASSANAQASAADLAAALLSTQVELAHDYFELRAVDSEREILRDTIVSYREALNVTTSLYRNGIDSEEDVVRARTQLGAAVVQGADLEVSRTALEHAIAVLIGKAPSGFSVPDAPLELRPPPVPVGVPSDLLERRPDVAAAERRVAAANAQIGIARAASFPDLTLVAAGGWESTQLSQWYAWPSRFWSIGPELAGTLFDAGARRAQTEEARAALDQTVAGYRQVVLAAFQEVEDNLAALRVLDAEAAEQQGTVNSAKHLLDLAMTRYQTGIDSYLNVVTAQTDLLSNREIDAQIRLRQMTASVSLIAALGGGWDPSRQAKRPEPVTDRGARGAN